MTLKWSKTTLLWPGLPQLWERGSWIATGVALLSAALLNFALFTSFGFSELVTPGVRSALWIGLMFWWTLAAAYEILWGAKLNQSNIDDNLGEKFSIALEHYLRGDYFQAEQILVGLLRRCSQDVDARLLLATLMRRMGRPDEASQQLDQLTRFENSNKWESEIRRERELILEAVAKQSDPVASELGNLADDANEMTRAA